MIAEKDIMFGILNKNNKSVLIVNHDYPGFDSILCGAFSLLAATDEGFYKALKAVVDHVDKDRAQILDMVQHHQQKGSLAFVKDSNLKS